LSRNAQKRDKNKIEQNNRGRKKNPEEKKPDFFDFFFRGFELPLLRNAQKTPLKKIDKK
jgi:hypothetical protein